MAPVMAKAPATATTVGGYLATLPEDRRSALEHVRRVILDNLPAGFEEGMQYGMIGYYVPHEVYPAGYHCDPSQPLPFAGLGSQKNHMALYLMCVYGDPKLSAEFQKAWKATGKKLDMGKACIRFKSLHDVPLDVVGAVIAKVSVADYIKRYETTLAKTAAGRKKLTKKKTSAKKTPVKKTKKKTAKKTTKKVAKKTPVKKRAKKKSATKKATRTSRSKR